MADLIEQFYQAYLRWKGPLHFVQTERTPPEMIVGPCPDSAGWIEWRMLPQPEAAPQRYGALETEIGCQFPVLFKQWHSRYYTLDMDISIVRLPACPLNDPLGPLRDSIFKAWKRPRELGLLPFGDEALMDAGDLCFDPRVSRDDADWPIVYWDHEYGAAPEEISPTIFSSFAKLLECCTHFLQGDMPDEKRRERIADFFAIDPDGAGRGGLDYWAMWIP